METATDPDLAERYHYLPEELRRRYAFEAMSYDSEKIQMEILEQARQQRPDDPYLEIESLKLEARLAGDERQAEIKARLEAISEGDHTLVDRAALCAAIEDLDFAPAEDCRQRFSQQVVEAGLHLSPFRVPDEARKLEDENWHSLIFEVRSNLVEKAVAGRDLAALETILIDGPGFGYGQLWGLALDLTETDDEQAEQAEQARELKALHQGLCARLGKATQDGSLDRPIYRALHVCPGRAESIADLLADCELEAEQRRLTQIISSRLSDLPDYYLRTGDAPVEARIDEVKRRLSTRELTPTELELLEDVLTDLLVGARDTAGLIEVGHRRVARFGDLNAEMRHWLERVRGVEGVEVEVLTDLLPIRLEDRLLRLRIAGERLRQAPPDLVEAQQLSQEVLRSRRASVRERAEANYLLGRVAVLEGRLEDATPLLAEFYETWIEHRACPAGLRGCDRDFPLHLIAIGDWPRLEAYQQRRSQELAEQVEQPSARMRYGLLHEDPAFKWLFLDDGCGLASALPHVEALAAERPDDPAVQARLLLERRRTCLRREGPYPWSQETQPMAGTFVDRESHLLLSDDYP